MDEKIFNETCAEFMGYKRYENSELYIMENGLCNKFNPFSDANDRNKVIEKMRINTTYIAKRKTWHCDKAEDYTDLLSRRGNSMEAAQNACIWAVFGVSHE